MPSRRIHIRHDLKTSLNHIVGYCDILLEDAREYRRTELSPGIEQILSWAYKLKRLISFYFDNTNDDTRFEADEIKKAFYTPLTQIITDARRLIVLFRQKAPGFVKDMEQLLSVSIQMYDLIDDQIIDIQIPAPDIPELRSEPIPEEGDSRSDREGASATVPGFMEIEYEDTLPGERAVIPAHILVVDDSEVSLQLISRHLRALGHSVSAANGGLEALQILATTKSIDIVILDLIMPEVSGIQVLRSIKDNPVLHDLPVIMMSAVDNPASIAQCIKLGAEDYLPKEFDTVILRARIEACLEKKRLHEQQLIFINALIDSQKTLARELNDAAAYVVGLLPEPLHGIIETAVALVPSADLGGDFCSHFWLDPEHLGIFCLDVSGHGIRSALQAVSISNIIQNQALQDCDFHIPSRVMDGLNSCYEIGTQNNILFTLWYGVLDIRTGKLTYTTGGSPPGILVRNGEVIRLDTKGLLLGATCDFPYRNQEVMLQSGDRLFIFSDGIYEIQRQNHKIFGLDEFVKLIPTLDEEPARSIDTLLHTVLGLTLNESFADDVCLLALEYHGPGAP